MKVLVAATLTVVASLAPHSSRGEPMQDAPGWQVSDIEDVRRLRAQNGRPWEEFLRVPDLYAGLYELEAGAEDAQRPHEADEVYYVLRGKATFVVEGESTVIGAGSVIYVAKEKGHRFVDITEDLSVLVFFATAGEAP